MRAYWEALHSSLAQSVRTLKAEQQFNEAKAKHKELSRFSDPVSLLVHLTSKGGELDEKDRIYSVLVEMGRTGDEEKSKLPIAILWLGLWPALDSIFLRTLHLFPNAPEELVSEIATRFTLLIQRLEFSRVERVAALLTRGTERDVMKACRRRWLYQSRMVQPTGDDATEPLVQPRAASELGVPATLSDEREVAAIREWLLGVVGEDADLVIGAAIYGETQRELGERLGLPYEVARKRFQRALQRVRERLEKKR